MTTYTSCRFEGIASHHSEVNVNGVDIAKFFIKYYFLNIHGNLLNIFLI